MSQREIELVTTWHKVYDDAKSVRAFAEAIATATKEVPSGL